MGWSNFDDVLGQLQAFGLDVEPGDIVVGTRQRCRHKDGGKEKRGWFQLYELAKADNSGLLIVGSYGCFWGAENLVQKIELPKADRQAMTGDQLAALKARIAEDKKRAEAETKRKNAEAAKRAEIAWRKCLPVGECAYLVRKGVESYGARFSPSGNMVIPMLDAERRIHGLQVIYAEKKQGRDKDFWPAGLAKKSHFFLIGNVDRILLIAEGFATAASLHKATGLPVAVAFDAGNLLPVAIALHAKYKRANILICADDDYKTEGNPGVTAARNAALAVKGEVIFPVFAEERPTETKGPTDFNDLHLIEGLHVVAKQVETHLSGLGWLVSARAARGESSSQGGGGKDSTGRLAAVSTMCLDDLVERFIYVDDPTGDFVFDYWTNEVCKSAKMIKLLPARVRGDDIKEHYIWKSRAVYIDQIGFDPGGEDKNVICNRWRGWPTKPKVGCCDMLLDLLRFICSADPKREEVFKWMLCWLAYPIQHPGAKMHTAIVVHGPQGTGKSRFFEAYAKIFGDYSIVINQGAIEDKFNSDWSERKLFVLADEIVARSDMYHLKNQLKAFITGEWVRVNPKNVAAHKERNHMNIVFTSNERMPVVLEDDDRRHCVVWTPPKMNEMFYTEVNTEIEQGGIEALHQFLLDFDIGDFKPWTKPPMTEAKKNLITLSLGSDEVFLREWQAGYIDGLPFCPIGTSTLYAEYLGWCKREGESYPRPAKHFLATAEKPGWIIGRPDRYVDLHSTTTVSWRCIIPPDEDLAKSKGVDYRMGVSKKKTAWLTECYFIVEEALQKSGRTK